MKNKMGIQWKALIKRTLTSILVAFAVVLGVCAVAAALVSGGKIGEDRMDLVATGALLLGTVTGAISASAGKRGDGWIACGAFALGWFLLLWCAGTLLFDGVISGAGVTALMCLGCSAGVCLCKMRRSNRSGPGRRHYKVRSFVHNAQ